MGEIRKDNLHESLIEELNELGNIDLSGKQDKTDESLLTESKDVIGAINELFQSANNGKELIASAIGEPLSSEDTFSAMSNDINGLLSTFKANMMNNGITVEVGDRFKSLIDKIATLSDSEGKGMRFAQGSVKSTSTLERFSISTASWFDAFRLEVNDLTFKPSIIILTYNENGKEMPLGFATTLVDTIQFWFYNRADRYFYQHSLGEYYYNTITPNLTDNGFLLYATIGSQQYNYYAIGVGEEDTTLRDSLASILEEEGVEVTEEDDMASLISKTDNQFNSLNTTITLLNNQVNSLTSELSGKVAPAGTAVASNVLTGKTFINSTGQTITGTMANNGTKTITPKASAQTLGAGYYDKITINGDADLVAANIVSGKNIFGVTGTASTLKSSSNFNYAFFTSYNTTIYINGGASDTKRGQNYLITSFTNNAGDCTLRISGLTIHVSQYYDLAYTVEFVRNGSVVYTSTTEEVGNTKFSKDYTDFKKGDVFNFYIKSISNSAKNSGVKDLMILGSLSV